MSELFSYWLSSLVGLTADNKQTRASFMSDEHCLTVLGKQHQIPFQVTGLSSVVDVGRAPIHGHAVLNMIHRTAAFISAPTTLGLAPRKITPPNIVLSVVGLI